MLPTIDSAALIHVSGGGRKQPVGELVAKRNCPGGAVVVADEKGELFSHFLSQMNYTPLAPGVSADEYCDGKKK